MKEVGRVGQIYRVVDFPLAGLGSTLTKSALVLQCHSPLMGPLQSSAITSWRCKAKLCHPRALPW